MPEKVNHNPDILSCLANLSSDEVFTPPEIANAMLDMLPQELFQSPDTKFLDPGCKSGVFLREIAKRLNDGLMDQIPDVEQRMDHIMKKQLFAIAVTQITGLISRRSVYCTKDASSSYSVARFDGSDGNIRYRRIEHQWDGIGRKDDQKCILCGAPRKEFDRGNDFETHAYEFIHMGSRQTKEMRDMRFDVIIANPPYQLSDGGGTGSSAKPIYNLFVEQAKKLNPRYLTMIIPSRWFTGGKGLDDFRDQMLKDRRIQKIIDYQDSRDCFPGVDIAGGVCYFLWNRDSQNLKCSVKHIESGKTTTVDRVLDEYSVFIRDHVSYEVIKKIHAVDAKYMSSVVLPRRPFGIDSSDDGDPRGDIVYFNKNGFGKYFSSKVLSSKELIPLYKTVVSKAAAEHAGQKDSNGQKKILSRIEVLPKNSCCSETYLVAFYSKNENEAENAKNYLKTRFVRFLISCVALTQNISRESFSFVPVQDFSKTWTDEELYKKYKLTADEIEFIESMIKPMDGGADA